MRPKITEFNVETNETTVREMNNQEFSDYELAQSADQAEKDEIKNKAIAKAAAEVKLEALGLTTDDLKALGL
jgi:hypothetical protein